MSVKSFNALPRPQFGPSGIPNQWHFDLRYIPLDPTPSHVLFLVQIDSRAIHSERLPLGTSTRESGIAFFPESGREAAPEVSKALLQAFVGGIRVGTTKWDPKPLPSFAPFKLTTEDPDLAKAVSEELKKIGVRGRLCDITVAKGKALEIAHTAFDGIWQALKRTIAVTGIAAAALTTPHSITFPDVPPMTAPGDDSDYVDESDQSIKVFGYKARLSASHPIAEQKRSSEPDHDAMKEEGAIVEVLKAKSSETARREADEGNAESAIDYALRLHVGIDCAQSRSLSRLYLVKALSIPTSSRSTKSVAHALLVAWHAEASEIIRLRDLHAAAHHANLYVELSPVHSPCHYVHWFASKMLEPLSHKVTELCVQYKAIWEAIGTSDEQMVKVHANAGLNRVKKDNRYRCANVACGIRADTGKMLAQCAGQCDPEKKPSYCSKECQRADWKIHKPFCRPSAPCSVVMDDSTPNFGAKTRNGALGIPIACADGKTRMFSSSTMSAESLKAMKAHSEAEVEGTG